MCRPAAPALMKDFTVRAMLSAPPQPVSASTSSGNAEASVMRRTSMSTSSIAVMPRSGTPSELAATPPPDKYKALNPVASAMRAAYAVMAPTICKGRSACSAARNFAPDDSGDRMGCSCKGCDNSGTDPHDGAADDGACEVFRKHGGQVRKVDF